MTHEFVDLFSDTKSKPTEAMREFMLRAEVGDEQKFEDPTVRALVAQACELLGKEDAVFLPSGTMCNEIAIGVHCRPGDEILCDQSAHILHFEAGGPSALWGAQARPLPGHRGIFDADSVRAATRPASRYAPRSRLLLVEQTTNLGGGAVWPIQQVEAVSAVAREKGLATHLDGARLFNAVVASGISARAFAAPFDSVFIDFTKGLGAPVGALLLGSHEFIAQAWQLKQRLGGAMRQSGIIAAAGLFALNHHVERLAEDHANARRLAEGLSRIPGIRIAPEEVETNILFFSLDEDAPDAHTLVERCKAAGIGLGAFGERKVRIITHIGVPSTQIDRVVQTVALAVAENEPA